MTRGTTRGTDALPLWEMGSVSVQPLRLSDSPRRPAPLRYLLLKRHLGIRFMKYQFLAAIVLASGFAMQANAACDYPVAPGKFPDGTQASLDEMKAAKAS